MWLEQNLAPEVPNSTTTIWDVRGAVDLPDLEEALRTALREASSLLVNFRREGDQLQVVARKPDGWEPFRMDVSDESEPARAAREFLTEQISRPFDLAADALFRIGYIRLGDQHHLVCLIIHHILTDAFGVFTLLSQRIAEIYRALRAGLPVSDQPGSPVAIAGEREAAYRSSERYADAERFWRGYVTSGATAARLPTGMRAKATQGHDVGFWDGLTAPLGVASYTTSVAASEVARWQVAAESTGTSVADLLTSAATVFLHRLCNTPKPMLSFTVNYRRGQIRHALGLYSNALPLAVEVPASADFVELAGAVRLERLRLLRHAEYNVSLIKRAAGHAGDVRSPFGPVVNVIPFLQEIDLAGAVGRFAGGTFGLPDEVRISTYVDGGADSDLYVRFDAPGTLYDHEDIAGLAERFVAFVRAALADPRARARDISVVTEEESATLLDLGAGFVVDLNGVTVSALLDKQAASTPEAPAVVQDDAVLTYRELAARADVLARRLVDGGAGRDRLVAVAIPRSIDLVVAVSAVLKAGAAYLPIDPDCPSDRVEFMLGDARPALLLTVAGTDGLAITPMDGAQPQWEASVIARTAGPEEAEALPLPGCSGEDAAYVHYRSGPPGQALGVVVTHAALANGLLSMQQRYGLNHTDRILHKAPASLNASVWEIFWPLIAGATVVLATRDVHRDAVSLAAMVGRTGVTTLHTVPSVLAELVRDEAAAMACSGLRRVMCSGEVLPADLAARFHQICDVAVHNLYGPTETAPDVTSWEYRPGSRTVPLGRPIGNTSVYLLDSHLNMTPAGVIGEVYVAGAGLPRGFLHRAASTAAQIVACPFGPPGTRMYRTGDLARWNDDGELEYAGSAEQRVQIRGFWVDPFEIEAVLTAHAGVAQAAVIARPHGPDRSTQLIAYVVPATGGRMGTAGLDVDFSAGLDLVELRRFAAARLPEHLVPATIVVLDRLPLRANGKRDRAALPEPQVTRRAHRVARTAEERILTDAFAEVLGAGRIGLDDDFFSMGGDSISAMRVVTLARAGGLALTARTVFECRTVAALAAVATPTDVPAVATAADGESNDSSVGPVPVPPMARLFAERGPGLDRLAQWLVLALPADMSLDVLIKAVRAVLDRHDVLRSRLVDGELLIEPPGSVEADALIRRVSCSADWSGLPWRSLLENEAAKAIGQISASAGQMVRMVWFEPSGGGPGRLLIAAHHLVVDGMSWRILIPDLAEASEQIRSGRTPALSPVGTSFRAWLTALANEARRPERAAELDLWRGILRPSGDPLGTRPLNPKIDRTTTAETLKVELPADLSRALLTSVPAAFRCGVDDVLLTALVVALASCHRGTGAAETVVRLEGHGRQEDLVPGTDLTRTVGWFTTVHPIRVDLSDIDVADAINGGAAAADALKRIKECRRVLPDQGIGYTLLRYFNEETAAVLRNHPADEVGFNYLGRFSFERSRANREVAWTPAPEYAELVAAPDPAMPLISALELNSLVTSTANGDQLQALFTFATGLLSTDWVRRLADTWQSVLRGIHTQASTGASGLTPSDMPLVDLSQQDLDNWQSRIGRVGDVWPLTPLQHGLLFHSLLGSSASASYQTQFVFRIKGPADAARLRGAAQTLLDRHPNLRVAFLTKSTGEPVQVVVDGVQVPFAHIDLTGNPQAEKRLDQILAEERETQFRPDAAPLLRFTLITLTPTQAELALTAHHVLFDGWSLPLIEQELMHLYAGGADDLEPVEHGYRDFLRWQSRQNAGEAIAAWAEELSDLTQPTFLAAGFARADTNETTTEVGQVDVRLTRQDAALVARQAAACGITPNVLVQGAWAVVLAQITGNADVLFGSSVTVRPPELPDAHTIIGMFTNTVPVRVRCAPTDSLNGMLQAVQDTQARTLDHYHVGLGDIQRATGLTALFDTIVIFESFPVDRVALSEASVSADLTVTGIRPFAPTHYPLTVLAAADPLLSLTLQYHPDALERSTVEAIADRLARVLRQFAADPQTRVAAVNVLSDAERQLVLHDWNDTAMQVPPRCVPEQFARQAVMTPDAVALEAGEQRLSYADLDERANRMAHWLTAQGIGAESRVVVLLPRSADLVAALLAVWKAGGCYVPVDPDHPAARVQSVIDDCAASLVLDEALLDRTDLSRYPSHAPAIVAAPDRAAYTIYTSGSTGTPKGVVIGHNALTNFLASMQRTLRLSASDRFAAVTTIAFDIAALELFLPLTTGAGVVLANRDHVANPQSMLELVEQTGVTVMQATPALWQMLATHDVTRLAGVRVLTGGEALPRPLAEKLCAHAAQVINLYGPTETTIWSTLADVATSKPPSIGTPIANTQTLILDQALRPVPPGVAGDLWIAGDGLARGYHRQPGMTSTRFVANPFGPPGTRMYRTGDVARWSRTGEIEFLGRADFQIKLRGYRIEPGDVEHTLTRHPAVREAVVTVREDQPGDKRLVGYVVAADDAETPSARDLQQFVRERLPDYMVPSAVITLPAIPLTANGKLDRSRLPRPETSSATYRAPESPREVALCGLFADVLGAERVGVDDDFFALGGHSLLATRLAARLRSDMGVEVPIRTIFAAPTVAELARRWSGLSTSVRKPLRRMTER
uniref:Long-chain-fatty-acid--CoA ligase n=1 Tax=uncultured bacterium esnapd8 TaxID=1366615 RepID=S5TME0_9BACT|nr:long-chain-fatty-acid--CoA ligase [uncultured bacterium esnapd8]